MRSCCAMFVIAFALSFSHARCQSAYEPIPVQNEPRTFQSDLLGISFTYPTGMVSVQFNRPTPDIPEGAVKN